MIREKYLPFVEEMHKRIRANFEKDGFLAPVAFIISYDGTIGMIGCPGFSCPEHKEIFLKAIKEDAFSNKAVGVMFASESWQVKMNIEKKHEIEKAYADAGGDFGKCPDKKEVIFIIEEYLDATYTTSYPIIRNDGKVSLGESITKEQKGEDFEGRFHNLLNKPDFDEMVLHMKGEL